MCVYCNMGDWQFRHNPPWDVPPMTPYVPQPLSPAPIVPWGLEKLKEYYDLLKAVKEMEDKLGCPCEPNKADYLALIEARIKKLKEERRRVRKAKRSPR